MRSFTTHSLPSHNKKDRSTYGLALRSFLSGGRNNYRGKEKIIMYCARFFGLLFCLCLKYTLPSLNQPKACVRFL